MMPAGELWRSQESDSCPYSPECVEVEFPEVRIHGVLRSSLSHLPRSYTGSTQESVQRPQPRPCVSISTVVRLERWMCFLVAERGHLPLREIANARATRGRIVR